jgi:hypothetical protein
LRGDAVLRDPESPARGTAGGESPVGGSLAAGCRSGETTGPESGRGKHCSPGSPKETHPGRERYWTAGVACRTTHQSPTRPRCPESTGRPPTRSAGIAISGAGTGGSRADQRLRPGRRRSPAVDEPRVRIGPGQADWQLWDAALPRCRRPWPSHPPEPWGNPLAARRATGPVTGEPRDRSSPRRTTCNGWCGSQIRPAPGKRGSRRDSQGEWACNAPGTGRRSEECSEILLQSGGKINPQTHGRLNAGHSVGTRGVDFEPHDRDSGT